MPKTENTAPAAAAVADPEVHPQTKEEIAANEEALGLAPTAVPVPTTRASLEMGVIPTTPEGAWRLSKFIAASELVPKQYQGRPGDVFVAIQFGAELGLPPMQALQSIFVANGRPELWGDGLLAVIVASPRYRDHEEYFLVGGQRKEQEELDPADLTKDDTKAVTTFWRADSPRPRTKAFSIAQAKKANLWTKRGPWQEYPDRMLQMRARGLAADDCFPDVIRGVADRVGMLRGDVVAVTPEPAVERPKIVRRISESTPVAATPVVASTPEGEEITIGPAKVHDVEQFLGGWAVTLNDGQKFDCEADLDALELEKFKGSDHALRFVCVKRDGGLLSLKSFGLAD
jgi:hypothetical protein